MRENNLKSIRRIIISVGKRLDFLFFSCRNIMPVNISKGKKQKKLNKIWEHWVNRVAFQNRNQKRNWKIWLRNCERKKRPKSRFWSWNLLEEVAVVPFKLDQDHQADEDLLFHQRINLAVPVYWYPMRYVSNLQEQLDAYSLWHFF
jgi:hypothetical protein